MKPKIKTIFAGTPDFSVPFLKALAESPEFEVILVITQADKPSGRKMILTPPLVKKAALELGLPISQPEKNAELKDNLPPADLMIVVAYGQIIPESMLNWPKYGSINVHASLLPKYRGAAPIQAAILHGDRETGVSLMKMEAGLDTGPVLGQNIVSILATDTAGSLFNKLVEAGLAIFTDTLKQYVEGKIKPVAQSDKGTSYVKQLKKSDGRIDWNKSAEDIERMVRAYNPWPGAYSDFSQVGQTLKILEVEPEPIKINKMTSGNLFIDGGRLAVQCGEDALLIKQIQPAGKKIMTGNEFLNGHGKDLTIVN